jgi:hypothetical protein
MCPTQELRTSKPSRFAALVDLQNPGRLARADVKSPFCRARPIHCEFSNLLKINEKSRISIGNRCLSGAQI